MPPLRDRKEDIPHLVEHFLVKYRHAPGAIPTTISEEAIQQPGGPTTGPATCASSRTPIERAVVLSRGNPITLEHLPFGEGTEKPIRYGRQGRRSRSEDDSDEPNERRAA